MARARGGSGAGGESDTRDGSRTRSGSGARAASRTVQAWVEPKAEDPEAVSALAVTRERLAAGRSLAGLRRLRVFELSGALPGRETLADLLHRSTQFYNPAKERCTLRCEAHDPVPLARGEHGLLVTERGGERRPAAERWWLHETGAPAEIREGVAWLLRFGSGGSTDAVRDLAILRDREHGLLCNPHWQEARVAGAGIPLPWITAPAPAPLRTASKAAGSGAGRPKRSRIVGMRARGQAKPGGTAVRAKAGSEPRPARGRPKQGRGPRRTTR